MLIYTTNQIPFSDEIDPKNSIVCMYGDISNNGSLRKELAMATLKKRRGSLYARVLWYDNHGRKKEKQVPLRTKSKVTARERLGTVNKDELDIKDGLEISFPWMNDEGVSKVMRFTAAVAGEEWIQRRQKHGIRPKTLEINRTGLDHFMDYVGRSMPLESITANTIDGFCDYMKENGLSDTSINIYLRTLKTMFRYYWQRDRLDRVPIIEQFSIDEKDPIYITDLEFQAIMELDWLKPFYKRVFYFYRETGLRLREPFMSNLDGFWLDIPNQSKGKKPRSIELSKSQLDIFTELMDWYNTCDLEDRSRGVHLSKVFKKALLSIGASDEKHFHSLRNTFAVRRIVENVPIYKIQKMMGHSSVTTTEIYARMELKRLAHDFPTLTSIVPEYGKVDTKIVDTRVENILFLDNKTPN